MPGQRLLAQLDLFENPEVVLDDAKYWNPEFVRHFIEAWDAVAYEEPQAGMRVAEVAVELVGRLDMETQPVLLPRALAAMGSSYRALEDLAAAEDVLCEVARLHTRTLVPRLDEVDYLRRMTYLRMDQQRWAEALDFGDQAVVLCQAEQAEHELGRACGARGAVYLSMIVDGESVPAGEPTASLSEALKRVDPRQGPHTYEAPATNLALALLNGYSCDLQLTLSTLKAAARAQAHRRITRKTLPNAQLRWNMGLVYLRIGSADALQRAGEILRRARRRLMEIGIAEKVVRISLDLARVYAALGHWGRLRLLAEEILSIENGYPQEVLAVLKAWHTAILREQVPAQVWRRVLDDVRWAPLAFPKERQRHPIVFTYSCPSQDNPPIW